MCALGGQLFQSPLYESCSRFWALWNSKLCRELGSASLVHTGPKSHLLTLGGITKSASALRTNVPAENPQGLWAYRLVFGFFFRFWFPGISSSSSRSMYLNIYLCHILSRIHLCVWGRIAVCGALPPDMFLEALPGSSYLIFMLAKLSCNLSSSRESEYLGLGMLAEQLWGNGHRGRRPQLESQPHHFLAVSFWAYHWIFPNLHLHMWIKIPRHRCFMKSSKWDNQFRNCF